MANQSKQIVSAFAPLIDKPIECKPIVFEKERVEFHLVPKAVKVSDQDGIAQDTIVYEPVEKVRYNLQDYIASFADDVGIQNILKKLALSGDKSLLNQTGREPMNENGGLEPIQDYSNVPGNKTEAFEQVARGVAAFDTLPEDLKGKLSLTQFAELFGQEEFDKYIAGIVAKQVKATEGGNKDE